MATTTRSVVVSFKAVGGDKVKKAGENAEKSLKGVGAAADEAGEKGSGLTDKFKDLSASMDEGLGGSISEALSGFDALNGVFGQVSNAANVLSGAAILGLVTSIVDAVGKVQDLYHSLTTVIPKLDEMTSAALKAATATAKLAEGFRAREKAAGFAPGEAPLDYLIAAAGLEAKRSQAEADLAESESAIIMASTERALALSAFAADPHRLSLAGDSTLAADRDKLDIVIKGIDDRVKTLAKAREDASNAVNDIGYDLDALVSANALPTASPDLDKVPKAATKAVADDSLRRAAEYGAAFRGALEAIDAEFAADAERARISFVRDFGDTVADAVVAGASAIARARDEAASLNATLSDGLRFMRSYGDAIEPISGMLDGMGESAAAAAVDALMFGGNMAEATNAIAVAATREAAIGALIETAKGLAFTFLNPAEAAAHFAAAGTYAAVGVVAGGIAAATGGLGGGGGGAAGAARPVGGGDVARGHDGGSRDSTVNVVFAGDVYDTREAAERALGARTIRGANVASRTPGGPRLRASALR